MNMNQLVKRDPAMAALMGAMPAGSDFGAESDFGDDYGGDAGYDSGAFGYNADFGAGPTALQPPPRHMRPAPHPQALAAKWAHQEHHTAARESLLNPNQHSTVKVENYSFTVPILASTGVAPIFGTADTLSGTNTPDTYFRPERATINVQDAGLVYVSEIKVGNVSGTVGGTGDGFDYSPLAVGTRLSLPLMNPSTKATFAGNWTTFVPPARVPGSSYTLALSFKGWATMAPT